MTPAAWIVLLVFGVSVVITWLMRAYAARLGFVDVPNSRSSHARPTARGGGVAIVGGYLLALLLLWALHSIDARTWLGLTLPSSLIALVGFADDRWRLSSALRFAVHLAAALLAIFLLGGIPLDALSHFGRLALVLSWLFAAVTFIWGTNLFNFMDGIDGIAGSEAVFYALVVALLNWIVGGDPSLTSALLALAAAALGFLVFNWPPASIFMGDVGSGFLGFTLLVLAILCSRLSMIPLDTWLIVGGVFLVDATVTVCIRVRRRERWREAHSTHAYQHMSRKTRSHKLVTLGVVAINVFWLLPWAILSATRLLNPHLCLLAALLPMIVLAIKLNAGVSAAEVAARTAGVRNAI